MLHRSDNRKYPISASFFCVVLVVARKPYLTQTLRLALKTVAAYFIEVLICIYNLTDDETFNLWDTSNLILGDFYRAIVTY